MAKRKTPKNNRVKLSIRDLIADKEYPVIETSTGIELEVLGVSILRLEEIKSLYSNVPVPQYAQDSDTVPEGEEPETFDLDEAVIAEEVDLERKAKYQILWDEYEAKQAEQTEQLTMQVFELLFGEGLRIARDDDGFVPEDVQGIIDKWVERRRKTGAEVPEDESKLHSQFIQLHAMATNEDITYLSMAVREQSGDAVSEADMESAVKSFRKR